MGIDLPKILEWRYRAMRLHVRPVVEAPKRKWDSRGTVEQRRGTFLGVGKECSE